MSTWFLHIPFLGFLRTQIKSARGCNTALLCLVILNWCTSAIKGFVGCCLPRPTLMICKGSCWAFSDWVWVLFLSLHGYSVCGVKSTSDRPQGRRLDMCKEQAAQHRAHGTPGTRRHVQGNQPLRPFPALLFYESRKFPDIVANYFHFPIELSDNA